MNMIKKVYLWLKRTGNILKIPYKDLKLKQPLTIHKRLNMWQKGFLSDKYFVYGLSKNKPSGYLSDYHEIKTKQINKPYTEILNNKILFGTVIAKYLDTPKVIAIVENGRLFFLDEESETFLENQAVELDQPSSKIIETLCIYNGNLVLKEIRGAMGKGFMKLEYFEPGLLLVNSIKTKVADFQKKLNALKGYMLTEHVRSSAISNSLFPQTANAIRVITMIDPLDGKAFMPAAVKKIGTLKSVPTDNFHYGAVASNIDLETGILSAAAQHTVNGLTWHTHHPDTKTRIEGQNIPNWLIIKEKLLYAAEKISFIKYIGWDIVDQDGGFSVLEGNNHPQMKVVQVHKPLLRDKRVAEFYKYHKVL